MLQTGIKGKEEILVTEKLTADALGSGLLPVFGTPFMIALIESTACQSVLPELEDGQGTVGTKLEVEHLAATPVGMMVYCETELVEVDRKKLVFEAKVYDETGLVGQGKHTRYIIDNVRFMEKALKKLSSS